MKTAVCLFIAVFLLAGCGSLLSVDVSSISDIKSHVNVYHLMSVGKESQENTLQYRKFKSLVGKILQERGFTLTDDPLLADAVIFFNYGIKDDGVKIDSVSTPVYGQTGISSANTIGGMTTFTPSYGVTGYNTGIYSYNTYTRWLFLSAYSTKEIDGKKEIGDEIWVTKAISSGSSADINDIFPTLADVIKDFIGTNMEKSKEITVRVK